MDGDRRVADYFIISGLSDNFEHNIESKPLVNPKLPITDVTVIFKGLGEQCPIGYECIEITPSGHVADLNNGNIKSPDIHICYRRGDDKPPLIEVGVYYEGRDRILSDVEIVYKSPYGQCASTGYSGSKSGTFITYRRAKTKKPYNQLVVVDLCIILNNKSEHAPHAFKAIKKNLNKSYYGMIGSEVFLCYKKTFLSPPSICYIPQIVSRFPSQDYANFPLPDTVPLFCLPAGANIELRPLNAPLPRSTYSTFVLTSDSAQKIYGSALTFYEAFDQFLLTHDQKARLGIPNEVDDNISDVTKLGTFASKSICILSRWPFFECFEKYLSFLHKLVFNPNYLSSNPNSPTHRSSITLEHHISHFLLDVSFPTQQRPTVLVQLMPGTDETVTISQPSSRLPLPLTGASFIQLLDLLEVEDTMNVLLFGLCEQKILLHSLNLWLLTGVAEAITAILFPFHWQCPYVPLCPLSLHGIINAPLPFIVGIDSRCFDTFTPPDDVICIDLDTKKILWPESKKALNARILPKRASRVLKSSLDKIYQKWERVSRAIGANQSPQHLSPATEAVQKRLELEIQEAFVRFMATILRGFRSYLLPITRAPTVGATDPTSLFNFEGFLSSRDRSYSQFYHLITRTQMFTHYIEERSFVSDKDTSLAFFDDCEEKLTSSEDIFSEKPIKLFDKDDGIIPTDRSVFIPAPEQSPSVSQHQDCDVASFKSMQRLDNKSTAKFGPLNPALFHRHPQTSNPLSTNSLAFNGYQGYNDEISSPDKLLFSESILKDMNSAFSISRRTKQEIKTCQKMAKKSADTPLDWSKYLLSCCYCLWFSTLPSYISFCKIAEKRSFDQAGDHDEAKMTARILRYAFTTIVRLQKLQFTIDEICFRILTLLCGYHGQPALAVRVFFEMKKAGIKPNAVTYGYYNKAVLESRWPDHSSKPTTVLWTKIRNVITGIALFKSHGLLRKKRRIQKSMQLIGDPNFYAYQPVDVVDRASGTNDLAEGPPIISPRRNTKHNGSLTRSSLNQHRRSLINRSFSTYQKSFADVNESTYECSREPSQREAKAAMHKSHSINLRNDFSPERESFIRTKSSSIDDDDDDNDDDEDHPVVQKIAASQVELPNPVAAKKTASSHDLFIAMMERHQLLTDSNNSRQSLLNNADIAANIAGLLFSTDPEICRNVALSIPQPTSPMKEETQIDDGAARHQSAIQDNLMLIEPDLVEPPQANHHHLSSNTALLNASSFGEDTQILRKLDTSQQQPDFSSSVDNFGVVGLLKACTTGDNCDLSSSDETKYTDRLSESMTDPSDDIPSNEDDNASAKNITSTPNFKLASLINDASNLQWSKWTSSQNSRSVYKGIKSAATGIVSQIQEFKSSFSISNNATPSKFSVTTHHKSTTTREMLSQWANYFSSQTPRAGDDDSDSSSDCSNDLLRLSNEEDLEPSSTEASDFRSCFKLFSALEKHYNNSRSKEDLVDHLTPDDNEASSEPEQVAIEIRLTTCSRCNVCNSLLYDEEIMERWSHNESNLNTKCVYCRAKIVPLMSIEVDDFRFQGEPEIQMSENSEIRDEDSSPKVANDLIDINFGDSENSDQPRKSSTVESGNQKQRPSQRTGMKRNRKSQSNKCSQQNFTVPYLSPIVLRKELESVFESSGDNCPSSQRFIDEHPIIFWNLLWYFSRINVPTHLALLCLNSRSILNGRSLTQRSKLMNKVVVRTLWDNDKLYAQVGKPLYRLLERGEPSMQVQAILCDQLHFTKNFLDRVIDLIRNSELQKAMIMILNARLKSSNKFSFDKNRHNLYRDLIFLINTYFGPNKLYMDNFEREYKRAFEALNFQQVALNRFDRPPTIGSLFCRKCFKELSLIKRG